MVLQLNDELCLLIVLYDLYGVLYDLLRCTDGLQLLHVVLYLDDELCLLIVLYDLHGVLYDLYGGLMVCICSTWSSSSMMSSVCLLYSMTCMVYSMTC